MSGDCMALVDGTLTFNDFSRSKSLARCAGLISTVSAMRLDRMLFDKYLVLSEPMKRDEG